MEVIGIPGSQYLADEATTFESAVGFIEMAACEMRKLHNLPIDKCDLDSSLDIKFPMAWGNIQRGRLSDIEAEFVNEHRGLRPIDLYQDLLKRRPLESDLVFTHGDPSMPNIIVDDGGIAGFVDFGGGGLADRYADFAIFFRSFRRNCRVAVPVEKAFCAAYGIDLLDEERLEFYSELDDLF